MATNLRTQPLGNRRDYFLDSDASLPGYGLEDRAADEDLEQRQLVDVLGERRCTVESSAPRVRGGAFVDCSPVRAASAAFARCGTGAAAPRMIAARLQVPSSAMSSATATSARGQSKESFLPCLKWATRRPDDSLGTRIAVRVSCGRKSFSRCRSRSGRHAEILERQFTRATIRIGQFDGCVQGHHHQDRCRRRRVNDRA